MDDLRFDAAVKSIPGAVGKALADIPLGIIDGVWFGAVAPIGRGLGADVPNYAAASSVGKSVQKELSYGDHANYGKIAWEIGSTVALDALMFVPGGQLGKVASIGQVARAVVMEGMLLKDVGTMAGTLIGSAMNGNYEASADAIGGLAGLFAIHQIGKGVAALRGGGEGGLGGERPGGLAEVHNHMMGMGDVAYFVDKVGNGSADVLLDRMVGSYERAKPASRADGGDSYVALLTARARMEAHDAHLIDALYNASTPAETRAAFGAIEADAPARSAKLTAELGKVLMAGETTSFDHTYETRELLIKDHIDRVYDANAKVDKVVENAPYTNYARDVIGMLHADGISYVEMSTSPKKIGMRFPEQMMKDLHAEAQTAGGDVDVRFLAGQNTADFTDIANPRRFYDNLSASRDLLKRADVIGIDIASPEANRFSDMGMARFNEVMNVVSEAAGERGRSLVLRPHVGEGYVPKGVSGIDHASVAADNVDTLLGTLEQRGYSQGSEGVTMRFGHATHASPGQIQRMGAMQIIAEANIGSNVATQSIANPGMHPLVQNLFYGTPTILSTDGAGVMGTTLQAEYGTAGRIIGDFRAGKGGGDLRYDSMTPTLKVRFDVATLLQTQAAYLRFVRLGDLHDTAMAAH